MAQKFDVIIIGGGPAGYEAAAIGARQGKNVLLIERDYLGGTCLNRGCIPTKSFCRSAEVMADIKSSSEFGINIPEGCTAKADMKAIVERKNAIVDQLRQGVNMLVTNCTMVKGEATIIDQDQVEVNGVTNADQLGIAETATFTATADKIIIATGSEPAMLHIPGVELALSSTQMLDIDHVPTSMVIIGGGVIGMEFASIFNAFGSQVTVIEYCKEILPPFDRDIAKRLRTILQKKGVEFKLQAEVTSIAATESGLKRVEFTSKDIPQSVDTEEVLMAVGRKPVIPAGATDINVAVTPRGIVVDENFRTTYPTIYAIGDCNGQCQLAHAASAQAQVVMGVDVDLEVIPSAVFTMPECAMVGLTEEQCKAQGIAFKCGKALFRGNGKAMAMGETEGLVKIIVNPESRRILGCHICGPHAADLVAEVALAMSNGLPVDALSNTIHSHPTLTEAVQQAARLI